MDREAALRGLERDLGGLQHGASVLHRLETAGRMARTLTELTADYVVEARRPYVSGFWSKGQTGASTWEEVATALHCTRQAARQRYGAAVVAAYGEAGAGYGGTAEGVR